MLKEMGLFGNYAPPGENPVSFPLKTLDQAHYLIGMRNFRSGIDKDLGERLAPFEGSLKRVSLAYEIIAYPLLEDTEYGPLTREMLRDAKLYPNQNADEHQHRKPIELTLTDLKILGTLTKERGLPFNPEKQVYNITELAPRADAQNAEFMRGLGSRLVDNAVESGQARPRADIEREIQERQAKGVQKPPTGQRKLQPPQK